VGRSSRRPWPARCGGRGARSEARTAAARATTLEVEAAQVEERLAEALRRRRDLVASTGLEAIDRVEPLPADELELHRGTLERLERRQAALGPVNPLAAQEYEEAKARASDVAEQIADLEGALRELGRLIRELTVEIRGRFDETFADVQTNFAEVVAALFPGGRGRLRLVAAAEPVPAGSSRRDEDAAGVGSSDGRAGRAGRRARRAACGQADHVARHPLGRREGARRDRVPVRADAGPAVSVLRARRGGGRPSTTPTSNASCACSTASAIEPSSSSSPTSSGRWARRTCSTA
jgi:hypothetical protein